MATNYGRGEYATRAVEEYKLALNADPTSQFLNNGLAELYFKTGKIKDAIVAAQDLLKKDPNNLDAHKLLGRSIYARSATASPADPPARSCSSPSTSTPKSSLSNPTASKTGSCSASSIR